MSSLPNLPIEIWRRIFAFVIRLSSAANAIDLEDPFDFSSDDSEPPLRYGHHAKDGAALLLVCSGWYAVASEILVEYLIISSEPQLLLIIKKLENSKKKSNGAGRGGLGKWIRRIDFQLLAPEKPNEKHQEKKMKLIIRLLKCTPNLTIYVSRCGADNPSEQPRKTPTDIIRALADNCGPSLRRIDWVSSLEAPSWADLAQVLFPATPNLRTLRLSCIYSYTLPSFSHPPPHATLPSLKTLSLGLLPPQPPQQQNPNTPRIQMPSSWAPLLHNLSLSPTQLPSLRRLDIDVIPPGSISQTFFSTHGSKIVFLRTASWATFTPLPTTLQSLPNLHTLVLSHANEEFTVPEPHPTLQRICIVPFDDTYTYTSPQLMVNVPPRVFTLAVLTPLDEILMALLDMGMRCPLLTTVRIRDVGTFADLTDHGLWLYMWWRRWNFRGVRFEDRIGRSFKNPVIGESSSKNWFDVSSVDFLSAYLEEDKLLALIKG